MDASDRAGYLFLALVQARVGRSLTSRLGDRRAAGLLAMEPAELAEEAGTSEKSLRAFEELKSTFDSDALEDRLARDGIRVLTLADEAYPSRLREVPDPPPALFSKGKVPGAVPVALVGSRRATAAGLETARALGRALGERGVCVVSGLALGVDAAAHEGALDAGGMTVGVLGCGIDVTYPRNYKPGRPQVPRPADRERPWPTKTDQGLTEFRLAWMHGVPAAFGDITSRGGTAMLSIHGGSRRKVELGVGPG